MKPNNQKSREEFKKIPSVDSIISECFNNNDINFPYLLLKNIIKTEIKSVKSKILSEKLDKDIKKILFSNIQNRIDFYQKNSLTAVINGTGIVLHTGLGRAPISKTIINKVLDNIYPYSSLEFNVSNNKRGERNNHISFLLNSILSSESSIIVNNNAAAVLLTLNTFANEKEVIISRGELVEIGGSFRIPDVITKANCKMKEIGTTNKTHLKDFENAINDNTGMIMIAHTSNYKVVGFTESVDLKDIVKLAKRKKIPIFLDLGSGALVDFEKYNLPKEKMVQDYIKMGVDIISFSGDKLIGGIQSGIICGKKKYIKKIHSNSMYRALRCDKFNISITENILRTYLDKNTVTDDNLSFVLLTRNRQSLNRFGELIIKNIPSKLINKYKICLIDSYVQAGSGSLPIKNIESKAIVFKNKNVKATLLSESFRKQKYPVIGYIKSNVFHIDLKAIPQDQLELLVKSIKNILK